MPARERPVDVGIRRSSTILRLLGDELHEERLGRGLSQAQLARRTGVSQSVISRIERQLQPNASLRDLVCLLTAVGLELRARAYPVGSPIRDVAHRALIERLRSRADPALKWRFEVPLPIPGDQRAWDAVIETAAPGRFAVEAETRLRDIQSLQRRLSLKRRDDQSIGGVVLLVAATRFNRRVLDEHRHALAEEYPLAARATLGAFGEGRLPTGNGVVLL